MNPPEIIQQMFNAYNHVTGFNVPFNMAWERMMWDCAQMGLTAEMITLVVKERLKGIKKGDRKPASLMPRNLFMGEDVINETLVEAHALLAAKRKIVDLPRQQALKQWGRINDEPKTAPAQPAAEVLAKLAEEFRKAAG